jgi:hypothetical protein
MYRSMCPCIWDQVAANIKLLMTTTNIACDLSSLSFQPKEKRKKRNEKGGGDHDSLAT